MTLFDVLCFYYHIFCWFCVLRTASFVVLCRVVVESAPCACACACAHVRSPLVAQTVHVRIYIICCLTTLLREFVVCFAVFSCECGGGFGREDSVWVLCAGVCLVCACVLVCVFLFCVGRRSSKEASRATLKLLLTRCNRHS